MRIRVLGSSAGGGLPQWNCGCPNCVRARGREPALTPQTQPSIAVSADGQRWSLVNASPDVRDQLTRFPGLHPRPGSRDLPLDTIVLTNADLDHVLGLLVLREALPHRIVSTPWVRDALLEHNAAWRLLEPAWGIAKLDQPVPLDRQRRLEARLFPVPGKVPHWLSGLTANHPEATAALRLTDRETGRRVVYAPGVQALDPGLLAELQGADCVFVDGTFFRADELSRVRPGAPDAHRMGHVPIDGPGGSLEALAGLPARRLYVHVNNTNPIHDPASPEAGAVRRAGIEIARDGREIEV